MMGDHDFQPKSAVTETEIIRNEGNNGQCLLREHAVVLLVHTMSNWVWVSLPVRKS